VINALAANGVPRLFYVSCAPASLARDLALLQARGFAIRSLEIFDFYPQTYHVESLAILER
jgi:tRNA/tmRNA/rRNA uracil-C5-methylase (TrmA/RlmC/RlmD family)